MPWRTQKARTSSSGEESVRLSFTMGWLKKVGVEVDAEAVFAGEVDPGVEVARLDLVAVHLFAGGEDGVAGVQADALFAGHEAHGLDKVRLQFLEGAGAAGIVARGLDAAGEGAAAALQADDVVALPAVDADGRVLQGGEGQLPHRRPRLHSASSRSRSARSW